MNKITLLGRLVRDPETKASQSGTSIVRFSLAVNRPKQKGQEKADADFISCVAFGNRGDAIAKYVHKGDKFLVEGSLRIGSYTNSQNVKIPTADIYVNDFEFVESRKSESSTSTNSVPFGGTQQGFDVDVPF